MDVVVDEITVPAPDKSKFVFVWMKKYAGNVNNKLHRAFF